MLLAPDTAPRMSERKGSTMLEQAELELDPFGQFRRWLEDAVGAGIEEPNAMTLATASPDGVPSARIVLLKAFDENGFQFSTNYTSRKAQEIEVNPNAALLFHWPALNRQVRLEGPLARCTSEESDDIFRRRPRGAQLGAWASRQSDLLDEQESLVQRLRELQRRFPEVVPRPEFWGGYRLSPCSVEFWQGRAHRLHDRFRYQVDSLGGWRIQRLAP